MINKVIATIEKHGMFSKKSAVVVALSGGSDSMAMLNALLQVKDKYNLKLVAAHVNHCLRGEQADADEAFVVDYCAKNGIEIKTLRADVSAFAEQNGMSFEEAGRKVRYDFFDSFGKDYLVATAHNADDRAETFLFNFTRGSTLRGLCSIPPVRGNVIRPIIDCSKSEILEFCKVNSIPYVTDATNEDVSYSRNRIRHNVISELNEINPSFIDSASRCIEALREDESLLSSIADELAQKSKTDDGYDCSLLKEAHPSVLKRAIVKICEKESGTTPEHLSVKKICDLISRNGQAEINGGIIVRTRKGFLDFPLTESAPYEPFVLSEGKNDFYSYSVEFDIINKDETNNLQLVSQKHLDYFFDYDKINGKVILRSRLQGDKICLNSRSCTKSLKKLFNELAIPPEKRNEVVVVADDCGVLAVCGAGIDSRAAVSQNTKKVLHLIIEKIR